eukprot:gene29870-39036_t
MNTLSAEYFESEGTNEKCYDLLVYHTWFWELKSTAISKTLDKATEILETLPIEKLKEHVKKVNEHFISNVRLEEICGGQWKDRDETFYDDLMVAFALGYRAAATFQQTIEWAHWITMTTPEDKVEKFKFRASAWLSFDSDLYVSINQEKDLWTLRRMQSSGVLNVIESLTGVCLQPVGVIESVDLKELLNFIYPTTYIKNNSTQWASLLTKDTTATVSVGDWLSLLNRGRYESSISSTMTTKKYSSEDFKSALDSLGEFILGHNQPTTKHANSTKRSDSTNNFDAKRFKEKTRTHKLFGFKNESEFEFAEVNIYDKSRKVLNVNRCRFICVYKKLQDTTYICHLYYTDVHYGPDFLIGQWKDGKGANTKKGNFYTYDDIAAGFSQKNFKVAVDQAEKIAKEEQMHPCSFCGIFQLNVDNNKWSTYAYTDADQPPSLLTSLATKVVAETALLDINGEHINLNSQHVAQGYLPPISESWKDPNTQIFVGVSHYRDNRCSKTVQNIFTKAKYPARIFVGIVQQIHTEKDDFSCLRDYCNLYKGQPCPHKANIQFIEFTHQEAKGPTYARYLQDSLIKNQEFCMQVDAHSDFIQNWDVEVASMWGSTNNEYAVLSTIPPDVSLLSKSGLNGPNQAVPHLCQATFDSRGMAVNLPPLAAVGLTRPLLSPLWSAGFSFSKCHAQLKTPSDPFLQWIFDGDEFSKFARLWTRGYDVYSPNKVVVVHDYHNAMSPERQLVNPLEWLKNGMEMNPDYKRSLYERGRDRMASLLGYPEGGGKDAATLSLLTRYGLGNRRTLDQLIDFTGVNTRKKEIFADSSGDVWGQAPEIIFAGGNNIPILTSGTITLELWWIFQLVDSAVERAINRIDSEIGAGHGHRVMKIVLLLIPVFMVIIYVAFWVLGASGGKRGKFFDSDLKKI